MHHELLTSDLIPAGLLAVMVGVIVAQHAHNALAVAAGLAAGSVLVAIGLVIRRGARRFQRYAATRMKEIEADLDEHSDEHEE